VLADGVCVRNFSKAVTAESAAEQVDALPRELLLQLLGSESLQASSELDVAQASWFRRTEFALHKGLRACTTLWRITRAARRCRRPMALAVRQCASTQQSISTERHFKSRNVDQHTAGHDWGGLPDARWPQSRRKRRTNVCHRRWRWRGWRRTPPACRRTRPSCCALCGCRRASCAPR